MEKFHSAESGELFLMTPEETKLQGTKLLNAKDLKLDGKALNLNEKIGNFIKLRLVEGKYTWDERQNALAPSK